jgi:Family of unknown function (DUF5996)
MAFARARLSIYVYVVEMDAWPELPYERWKDTLDTLHLKLQIPGKVRLALTPPEPQWANVPYYVTARGLTTGPMESGGTIFQTDVDLIDHDVLIRTTGGEDRRVPLGSGSVADFYGNFMSTLASLGVEVTIRGVPDEVVDPIPFAEDAVHSTYEPEWANRFWTVLSRVDLVMKEYRSRSRGRTTPVHFFWGSFDLACTRFSGRPAAPPAGADLITRRSDDAEQICVGFWPGDRRFPAPAFYSYTYPKPGQIEEAAIEPASAGWNAVLGEFALLYDDVRRSDSPGDEMLQFFVSSYAAGATLSGWDPDLIAS